jgi:16S rRNA (cytidine1402-2'-O)-methyltransferase
MEHKAKNAELLIVATPIGNLADITYRAVDTLKQADMIYCEDTRHSRKLLERYAITTPLRAYHEHNAEKQRPLILEQLAEGNRIALISDAGTPLISDPGYKLVQEAREAGYRVTPLPGACAAVTALCAAGLPSDRFLFVGFLPAKSGARRQAIEGLTSHNATLVFYESPKRLAKSLNDLADILGPDHSTIIARELTKQFEEFKTGPLKELAEFYEAGETPKGEIVILIDHQHQQAQNYDEAAIIALLTEALKEQSVKAAAAEVAKQSGWSKRDCYQLALSLN